MKLLLDTHIWLWYVGDSQRLGDGILHELQNPDNELWLSPMSTWEALTLHHKKRMWLSDDLEEWLEAATLGIREAHFTHEIALAARELRMHKDPADRILCGTALVMDLILVTADEPLLGLGNIRTLANR
ncbi:MAG TPA: type II toxin-antitoxin system VapC family toxin [Candidatus Acidoferrum sp.]|nr:type II toxin-antitoxin system VapC family toxin [Candidatus Acidoferrum sp.]